MLPTTTIATKTQTHSPAVLIAHGGWHTPLHYKGLVDQLSTAGFHTSCPTMATSTNTIPPEYSMPDDTAIIRSHLTTLADAGHPIILLMHSFGGVSGTNALQGLSFHDRQSQGLPGGVIHLIYMIAFVLPINTMTSTTFSDNRVSNLIPDTPSPGTCSVRDPRNTFYNDLPEDEQDYWVSKLVVCPMRIAFEPITYTPYGKGLQEGGGGELDGELKATYIVGELDPEFTAQLQEASAALLGPKCRKVKVKSGHSPMLSRTSEVVEIVKETWEASKKEP